MPVVVFRGAQDGKRFLLTSGVHGDELNGIAVAHDIIGSLDPATMRGAVTIVPGVNTPGLLAGSRGLATRGVSGADLNRTMPGKIEGSRVEDLYAHAVWTGVFAENADAAVDLHTQSAGTSYGLYVFADPRRPYARRMADLMGAEVIKLDKGEPGSVETELNAAGVDAITFELGEGGRFEPERIARGVRGVRNVLMDLDIIDGAPDVSGPPPFVGVKSTNMRATQGGFVRLSVGLGEAVEAGQAVATVHDAFGAVAQKVQTTETGIVSAIATDPVTEPGRMVVRILSQSDDPACAEGC